MSCLGGHAGAVLHGHPGVGGSDDIYPTLECEEVLETLLKR